jgi:hypothetical protein
MKVELDLCGGKIRAQENGKRERVMFDVLLSFVGRKRICERFLGWDLKRRENIMKRIFLYILIF